MRRSREQMWNLHTCGEILDAGFMKHGRIGSKEHWCFFTVLRHNSRKVKSGGRRKLRSGGSDPGLKRKCGIRLNICLEGSTVDVKGSIVD
eukprot:7454859-Pyramimonas_sp.AAC.1